METTFTYDRFVTGRSFVGRKAEREEFTDALSSGLNISLYDSPKTGKHSLLRQCLLDAKIKGMSFKTVEIDFTPVRKSSEFLNLFARSLGEKDDRLSPEEIFDLPRIVSGQSSSRLLIICHEFQNILRTEDSFHLLKALGRSACADNRNYSYIWIGSQVNAMKQIFEKEHFCRRQVCHITLSQISFKEVESHITKGFLMSGKVIEKEYVEKVYNIFQGNICYLNHFAAICDGLSRGFITDPVVEESLQSLLSIHHTRFLSDIYDLTGFQISLLRAILDGQTRLSSTETIATYGLNSSANVKRLKEALCKKEIVVFDASGKARLQDPLFEYWLRKYYFIL